MDGIDEILTEVLPDTPHRLIGPPPIFGFILGTDEEPTDFRAYQEGDADLYERLIMALIERGVMPDSDGREPWFLSYSHDDEEIGKTLTAFADAVKAVKR
jgi:glutamate-1-semialdehyde aminotransferase